MPLNIATYVAAVGNKTATGIAAVLESPITREVSALINAYSLERNPTGAAFVAMARALAAMEPAVLKADSPNRWRYTYQQTAARENEPPAQMVRLELNIDAVNAAVRIPTDLKAWLLTVVESFDPAHVWLLDLAACHQMSPLKPRSISSYFAAFNGTVVAGAALLPLLNYAASRSDRLIVSPDVRNILTENKFMRYHTSYASTPGIILQMIEGLGRYAARLIDPAVVEIVREAEENYWSETYNARIPMRLIAMAWIWRDVNGRELPDWKQGARSLDVVSAQSQTGWRALFKRINTLAVQDLSNIENEDELLNAIPHGLAVGPDNLPPRPPNGGGGGGGEAGPIIYDGPPDEPPPGGPNPPGGPAPAGPGPAGPAPRQPMPGGPGAAHPGARPRQQPGGRGGGGGAPNADDVVVGGGMVFPDV